MYSHIIYELKIFAWALKIRLKVVILILTNLSRLPKKGGINMTHLKLSTTTEKFTSTEDMYTFQVNPHIILRIDNVGMEIRVTKQENTVCIIDYFPLRTVLKINKASTPERAEMIIVFQDKSTLSIMARSKGDGSKNTIEELDKIYDLIKAAKY